MEHGQFLRLLPTQRVHDIESEVEFLLALEGDLLQQAVFHSAVDEVAVNAPLFIRCLHLGVGGRHSGSLLALTGSGVRQNDGIEGAILTADGDHAVGRGGIVVDGVAGVEDLTMAADLDLHVAPDDDIALLTLVGHQFDIFIFRAFPVLDLHVQRQGDTVAEAGGQIVAHHVVRFLDALAFAFAGQGVGAKLGAAAFQQIAEVHAEA